MKKITTLAVLALLTAACGGDARGDLPQENQDIERRDVTVYQMPDQFPNVATLCTDMGDLVLTNTRANGENMIIVPDHPECEPE